MDSSPLCEKMKKVARQFAFGNSEVLFVEGQGRRSVTCLLDYIWEAIFHRKDDDIGSNRKEAFSRYVFSLISPNYVEASDLDKCTDGQVSVLRYRELRLLADMLSGMTDRYSIDLHRKIAELK